MSLGIRSRYRFCTGVRDAAGREYLDERVPFIYRARADNREHVVRAGDTLIALAATYFPSLDDCAELWWLLGDFQPDSLGGPIHDPTVELDPATRPTLVVPSLATVLAEAFGAEREAEHAALE